MPDYFSLAGEKLPDCDFLKIVDGRIRCEKSNHSKSIEDCELCIEQDSYLNDYLLKVEKQSND